jgi:hypothetical protein
MKVKSRGRRATRARSTSFTFVDTPAVTFLQERHEQNDGRRRLRQRRPIDSVVARRIHQRLELGEHPFALARQFLRTSRVVVEHDDERRATHLPRERQSADGDVAQAHDDGEERVEISEFFATMSNETSDNRSDVVPEQVELTKLRA